MKKFIFLFLGLSLVLSGCKKPTEPANPAAENLPVELPAEAYEPTFESSEYGFRVLGPEGWIKQADSMGMLVTYLKPGDPETFQENITIARELKPTDMDFETYAEQTRDQVLEYFEGAELKRESQTEVDGLPGVVFRFGLQVEDLGLEAEQIVVERQSEFMVFTFMALPEQFPAAYDEFNQLMESVQFVGAERPS